MKEDFAEAFELFVVLQGTPCLEMMQLLMPGRYAVLSKLADDLELFE